MKREVKKPVPVPVKHERKPMVRPWNPFEEMDRMFETLLPRGWVLPFRLERTLSAELPKVDVIDRDAELLVRAEVPGVKKDELEVSIVGDTVTIKSEHRHEEKEEKGKYYRCEISHKACARTVVLPAEVDAEKAAAEFTDGVLEIRLPKLEHAKRRLLKVA